MTTRPRGCSPSTSCNWRCCSSSPGGLQNPFSLLFLAPVLISATALPPLRTLFLGLLAVGCSTLLALAHLPLPLESGRGLAAAFSLYQRHMAGDSCSARPSSVSMPGASPRRDGNSPRRFAATELVLAREQHLSQIDGLAAAAAHELGTPLGTITVIAKELARRAPADSETAEDLALLRDQAERCRAILGKLTSLSEEDDRGFLERISLGHLIGGNLGRSTAACIRRADPIIVPQPARGPAALLPAQWTGPFYRAGDSDRHTPVEFRGNNRCR